MGLISKLAEWLEMETQPEMIEFILLCISRVSQVFHLMHPTEEENKAITRIVDYLKRGVKTENGTSKCAKYTVLILSSFLPSTTVPNATFDVVYGLLCSFSKICVPSSAVRWSGPALRWIRCRRLPFKL